MGTKLVSAPKLNGRYGSVSRPRRDAREWAKRAESGQFSVGGRGAGTRLTQSRRAELPRDMIQLGEGEGYVENWGTVTCRP